MAYPDKTQVTWEWGNYVTGNVYLDTDDWQLNVSAIQNWLCYETNSDRDMPVWTMESLCGLLGNLESESGFNPGIWQGLAYESGPGLGLCQWTPYTNLTNFATSIGRDYWEMYTNLKRIDYEFVNGLQYYPTSDYNISFSDFIQSSLNPGYLAEAWLYNYERPADPETQSYIRHEHAVAWYAYLTGTTPSGPTKSRSHRMVYWPKRKIRTIRRQGRYYN